MRLDPRNALLLPAIVLVAGLSLAAAPSLPQGAIEVLDRFLTTDCEVGDEGSALDELIEQAVVLEPELERVLLEGPGSARLAEVTRALELRWELRAAFLESGSPLGLAPEALLALRSTSRAEFIERGRQQFETTCRERAIAGLAGIGSPSALRALRKASRAVDEELRRLIQLCLERARPHSRALPHVDVGRGRSIQRTPRH